jgi:hypothetical protein
VSSLLRVGVWWNRNGTARLHRSIRTFDTQVAPTRGPRPQVALFSENGARWLVADQGIMMAGGARLLSVAAPGGWVTALSWLHASGLGRFGLRAVGRGLCIQMQAFGPACQECWRSVPNVGRLQRGLLDGACALVLDVGGAHLQRRWHCLSRTAFVRAVQPSCAAAVAGQHLPAADTRASCVAAVRSPDAAAPSPESWCGGAQPRTRCAAARAPPRSWRTSRGTAARRPSSARTAPRWRSCCPRSRRWMRGVTAAAPRTATARTAAAPMAPAAAAAPAPTARARTARVTMARRPRCDTPLLARGPASYLGGKRRLCGCRCSKHNEADLAAGLCLAA